MNNDKLIYGSVGLILGLVLAGFFANYAVNGNRGGMMQMMGINRSSSMMQDIDKHFIDQMIPHHEDAITMAEMALKKAEHQEVKDLAQKIITAQNSEIKTMKEYRTAWSKTGILIIPTALAHGMEHGLNMGMMGDVSDLEDMENAKPFDKKFMEEMIPHHQAAIMMASMVWNSTTRPEMKQLTNDIMEAQTAEINQMRSWYKQWYQTF